MKTCEAADPLKSNLLFRRKRLYEDEVVCIVEECVVTNVNGAIQPVLAGNANETMDNRPATSSDNVADVLNDLPKVKTDSVKRRRQNAESDL
jgi:hypothetical protein